MQKNPRGAVLALIFCTLVLLTPYGKEIVRSVFDLAFGSGSGQTAHQGHPQAKKPHATTPSAEPRSTGGGGGTPTYIYAIVGVSVLSLSGGTSYIFFRVSRRRKQASVAVVRTPKDIEKELAESPTYLELQAMEAELTEMLAGKSSDEETADREVIQGVLKRVSAQVQVERAIAERKLLGGYSRRLDEIFVERGQADEYPLDEQ